MAAATGGQSLDICATDFSPLFQAVADKSFGPQSLFHLSAKPDPASLTVTIDGTPVTSGWTYDAAGNAVVFAAPPGAGAQISIHYRLTC
jgi:hypothetical protein